MSYPNIDELMGDSTGPWVFRKEGEYWTIAYGGTVFRLRDAKGMRYLAHLLAQPGRRFPAAELLKATVRGLEDSDRNIHQVPGTGNQGPSDERARLMVTQRIRAALTKIQTHDPSLGHHLSTCIKTGNLCAYVPDPSRPIAWVL